MEVEPMPKMMERTLLLNTLEESRDAQLVKDAREGCRAAFDVLFQRHKQFVYNVCYRMLGSGDDAVDATEGGNERVFEMRSIPDQTTDWRNKP